MGRLLRFRDRWVTLAVLVAVGALWVTLTASGVEKLLAADNDAAVSVSIVPRGFVGTPVTVIVVRIACRGLVLTALTYTCRPSLDRLATTSR